MIFLQENIEQHSYGGKGRAFESKAQNVQVLKKKSPKSIIVTLLKLGNLAHQSYHQENDKVDPELGITVNESESRIYKIFQQINKKGTCH